MMNFIKSQERRLAARLLAWRFQRMNQALPAPSEMERLARNLVDDAHRIAGERGRNVIAILKEMVDDIKK